MHRTRARLVSCLAAVLLLPILGIGAWAESPPPVVPGAATAETAATPPPAPPPFAAPAGVIAADTPSDGGGSITVHWNTVPGAVRYRIERAEPDSAFTEIDKAVGSATSYKDEGIPDRKPFVYRIVAMGPNGEEGVSASSAPAFATPQWFKKEMSLVLISILSFMLLTVYFIRRARSGEHLFIRRIAGLEAVDEAVGRATEMGRQVLFVSGTADIDAISTIASMNVLGEIAKKTARYGTTLRVPNCRPVVYTVAREIVKGSYTEAGRPDSYDPESVYFLCESILAYATAICGIMSRELPAANFLLGTYGGESLILAETGAMTGAIQIAGTDSTTQLPFFVVACDYTLLGEELYAASAYLSREPLAVGALKGQDWGKFVLMVFLVVGTIIGLLANVDVGRVLITSAQ